MKRLLVLAAAISLAGCSSLPKTFANRVGCTLDKKDGLVASMYGRVGIVSYVDADDSAAMCAGPMAPAAAAAAASAPPR